MKRPRPQYARSGGLNIAYQVIGDGPIDLRAEIGVLRAKGYRGAISLELFNRDLWAKDPRDVLQLGIQRLRELLES